MSPARISDDLQKWIDARKRHHLSHAHIQMARELGMKPKSLGKMDNHRQERWKLPLPQFIEELYLKRFGKERPSAVFSIEEHALRQQQKKAAKREARNLRRETAAAVAATAGNDPGADAEQPPEAGVSAAPHRIENDGMNVDYDQEPPFPVADYRAMQRAIPGVEALYLLVRAALDSLLQEQARVLLVGAGGGRQIETLAPSPKGYSFIAVDPSVAMLDQARACAAACAAQDRTMFIPGLVYDVPEQPVCDAATSLLVCTFWLTTGRRLTTWLRSGAGCGAADR